VSLPPGPGQPPEAIGCDHDAKSTESELTVNRFLALIKRCHMAFYKYPECLARENGSEFDNIHQPNTPTPYSGIYRCEGCGLSATFVKDHNIPPQNHHQHQTNQGAIRWRLIVKSHWA